ncbi:MAG: histidine phosphatase family protein [Pseudomonadota bacterium]
MRTLILMRHAKAEPPAIGQRDHDRGLTERGRRSAVALGDWLRAGGHLPDAALVSSAQRTRQTWDGLALEGDTPVTFLDTLYNAVPASYMTLLAAKEQPIILAIGHNPAFAALASHVLRGTDLPANLARFPTGATIVAQWDADDWEAALATPATLKAWTIPRTLTD